MSGEAYGGTFLGDLEEMQRPHVWMRALPFGGRRLEKTTPLNSVIVFPRQYLHMDTQASFSLQG